MSVSSIEIGFRDVWAPVSTCIRPFFFSCLTVIVHEATESSALSSKLASVGRTQSVEAFVKGVLQRCVEDADHTDQKAAQVATRCATCSLAM